MNMLQSSRKIIAATLFALVFLATANQVHAGAGWGVSTDMTGAPTKVPTYYANSPAGLRADSSPTAVPGAMINSGMPLRKFVDALPGLGAPNNLGQYIPVAVADTASYPGSDYYELGIVEYTEKMHSDLPKATTLRGYVQLETAANAGVSKHVALKYPDGTAIRDASGNQIFAVDNPHYLGPLISATRDVPVRIKYSNLLPKGRFNPATGQRNGDLFLPVDMTIMGAGLGPDGINSYTQNRAEIHLHGGDAPWISDGTPHQWITPAGENTPYKNGVSFRNVPDMLDPGQGSGTLYWPNGDSARLMFYHDHASGMTRLNVYGGIAAGYLLSDPVEQGMVTAGALPVEQIPLVIQDKTFVPADIAQQDAKWSTTHWGKPGDLWFPHVYETNQDPNSFDGTNPVGRWDYGPWFWPVFPAPLALPTGEYGSASIVPEGFMDTPVVNGTAYPTLTVQPKAYRFRILSAGNDRSFNLGLYLAEPLTIVATTGGSGYSATPNIAITGGGGTGATATAVVTAGVITGITVTNPGTGYTSAPTVTITDATGSGAIAVASLGTEVKMVPAVSGNANWPATWPIDGREGGVPDPAMAGPDIVQIGSEGGFLPAPAVIPSTPVNYEYNRRSATVLNILTHGLYLAPAERADAVIDFSGYCPGTKFILYNDAPAPVPGFDPRVDYYTGNPDQTAVGGAPSTLPGYGPNTRTVMQIVVAGTPNPACVQAAFTKSTDPNVRNPMLAALRTALPAAYAASQPKPIVGEAAYSGLWGTTFTNTYARILTGSLTMTDFTFTDGNGAVQTLPVLNKAIQELFDPNYGRMNATLGIEMPFTSATVQTTIPLNYIDPITETINDGETQIWKITHNGVDTHPVHFHMVNVQLINRIGWDGTVKPPDDNELGWKEAIRMNPLEDVVVAVRPKTPMLPFGIPESVRSLDPTQPLGSAMGFTQVDLTPGSPTFGLAVPNGTITNVTANFGWEYVWHCHILGHEENDFMRPFVFKYTALQPPAPANLSLNGGILSWTDPTPATAATTLGNQANEIGFRIERATNYGAYTTIGTALANATSFIDTSPQAPLTDYSYRVIAYNTAGDSLASNVVTMVQQPGGLSPGALAFAAQAVGTSSTAQRTAITNTGAGPLSITGVTISGAGSGDFAQVNDCIGKSPLAVNASCAIDVTFTPATGSPSSAMLSVATSRGSMVAGLSGAGQVASFTLTPTPILFAARQIGTTSLVKQVTLTNTGGAPLSINSIVVDGTNAADFSQTNNCGATLASGFCTINVVFTPGLTGDKTATVTVSTAVGTQRVTLTGKGIAPSAELNPTSPLQMAFAIQQIGTTSAPSVATLTNTGIGPLSISSIAIIGMNATDFAQTNNCPATLPVGTNCTINVTFRPLATAPRSATLTIATAAGQKLVGLSGGSLAPTSTVTPSTSLTFALRQIATTSAAQTVTLANTGAGPLSNSSITISGANAADFAQTNNCPATMAAGTNCTINVTFKPTAVGARTATLDVVDSAGSKLVTLNGTGQAALSSTLSSTALTFADQQTGTASAAQPVTLTNTGALALTITSIAIGGANAADFSLTQNCGASLAAGAASTCTINVAFNPNAAGARTATLTTTDASGTHTVALSGTGKVPLSSLMPSTQMGFADQQAGTSSAAHTVVLSNTGIGPLSITGITVSGANAADFAQTNTCGTSLVAGLAGTCTINVVFAPGAPGAKSATLTVVDAAGNHTVALSGTGTAPASALAPAPLTFADQQTGTSSTAQPVTLTNMGIGPLSITSVTVGGANAADFTLANHCGTSLPTGTAGSCSIDVTFTPGAPGARAATLAVVDASGTHSVSLNGMGITPAATLAPIMPFALQQVGTTSAAQSATLTNTGIGPLAVTGITIGGTNAVDFAQTNDCGTSVAVGASCTINIVFKPGLHGAETATLTVTDAAGTHTITLNGSGTTSTSSLAPVTPLVFALQQVGTTSTAQPVTLTNTGVGPLAVASITIGGANAADFAQTNNCGTSVAVGANCTISVTYKPGVTGAETAMLTVADGAGTKSVTLNGTGAAPAATLTPTAPLVFAAQQVGIASATQPVTLANTGVGPLSISRIMIGGANPANFLQSHNCGTGLAVGTSCTINVAFKPDAPGPMAATLMVMHAAGTHTVDMSSSGAMPAATLTPAASLTFAAQQVGTTSAAQPVTLTNTGVVPLSITSIKIGGVNPANFLQSNNCQSSLAIGASCTINVTFKPNAAGTRAATLVVIDSAGTRKLALDGTGASPSVTLAPSTPLAFAAQRVDTASAPRLVTLTNMGISPLPITSITINGVDAGDFTQTQTCGTSVAAGASCTISVRFKPKAVGAKVAMLVIVDGAGTRGVDLSGTGAVPSATLLPAASLSFAAQQLGTTSPAKTVTLSNSGIIPLAISSIKIGGANPVNFLQTNNCGTSLATGASCTIDVAFKPNAVGARTAALIVADAAGIQKIALDGTGAVPSATLAPAASLSFAAQQVGATSAIQLVTLTNSGVGPLSVASIAIGGANPVNFSQTNDCGASLTAGTSCTISVAFSPKAAGTSAALLTVIDGAGTQNLTLDGTGAAPSATLAPAASLSFATQQVGTISAIQPVTLSNSGVGPLSVASIAIGGANPASFSQTSNCGASLAAGASCTIDVTFSPKAASALTAWLTVTDGAGTHKISLDGTGAMPSATLAPAASLSFAAQQLGAANVTQPVTLSNSGVGPLSISSIMIGGANPASFSQTNNCGASLAAGASCTIDVTFSPKAASALTALLTVTDGAGTHKISLDGTGAMPSATLAPAASLSFAAQQVGTISAIQPVMLTNSGVGPLSVASIAIAGANPFNFSQTNNCGASLVAGASCTINVTFKPNASGARAATLTVVGAAGAQTVALDGIGQ